LIFEASSDTNKTAHANFRGRPSHHKSPGKAIQVFHGELVFAGLGIPRDMNSRIDLL
jgi:hypothetical protein